jgi:hypothetical protein
MNRNKKRIFKISLISVILLVTIWVLKDFNLSWVEVNDGYAKVTVNFLFPMNKDKLPSCIRLTNELPYASQFDYSVQWLTDSVACIKLKEQNLIKGQKVQLIIKDAPSKFSFVTRNASINIQFKTNVLLIEPREKLFIATEKPFLVKFNTPMNKNKLHKFLECDAPFYIEPSITFNSAGKKVEDTSAFIFTPKTPLANGHKYILSFRKGMPSESGSFLKQDLSIILTTDNKPIISSTYPDHNSKWIGLYPKLKFETESPTVAGYLSINNEKIKGKNIDPYHVEFLLNKVLEPETVYEAVFQAEAASGELSLPKTIHFTTVRLEPDRIWIEVLANNESKVNVYKGKDLIKTMRCSIGDVNNPIPLGTYYSHDKGTSYIDSKNREGANFYIKVSDACVFQGLIRDAYWNINPQFLVRFGEKINRRNIILKDEDARWLYENTPSSTMIILHK